MRKKITLGIFFFFFMALVLAPPGTLSSKGISLTKNPAYPQNVPEKKPKYDYMSTIMSRNARTLGLKMDPILEKLLKQPSIKWAIRAGAKHVLD